jgi:hypothetical protein
MQDCSLTKVVIESTRHPLYGKTCDICNQPMRANQQAIVHDAGRGVYVQRETIWHRMCMEEFTQRRWPKGKNPEKAVEAQIRRLRRNGSRVPALLGD